MSSHSKRRLKDKLKETILKSKENILKSNAQQINHSQDSQLDHSKKQTGEKRHRSTDTSKTHSSKANNQLRSNPGGRALAAMGKVLSVSPFAKVEKKKKSKVQAKIASKLSGSKFRWLNETLYTAKSDSSFELFSKEPELFSLYHEGFASQVSQWPVNPLNIFIKDLCGRTLENRQLVVADMGCGEAALAQAISSSNKSSAYSVHSFDLVAGNEFITACDIANVPLASSSVDITIFCLSLMGTNFIDFLIEANRILKVGGELMIAEVVSRIEDLKAFIKGIERLGFKMKSKDTSNKMFVLMAFTKVSVSPKNIDFAKETIDTLDQDAPIPKLKPCIYKRR